MGECSRDRTPGDEADRTWCSLEEYAAPGRARVRDDLPVIDPEPWLRAHGLPGGLSRRRFLELLGASAALAGLGACGRPDARILPYVEHPPEITPGQPLYYATAMSLDGFATGLLVESHTGRPTKIEGNPAHPASLGAAGVYEQAAVLGLYDRDRSRQPWHGGQPSPWPEAIAALDLGARVDGGRGLRFLLTPTSSVLEAERIDRLRERFPGATFHFWTPVPFPDATTLAADPPALLPQFDFAGADVILALDADFLASGPFYLRYAREFAERRRPEAGEPGMNRLHVVEPAPTVTGAAADERLAVRGTEVADVAAGVLAELLAGADEAPAGIDASVLERLQRVSRPALVRRMARDLAARPGRSVVIAGPRQPAHVHALVHALNALLGNLGRTVRFTRSPLLETPPDSLVSLLDALAAGEVDTLVMAGVNPAYDAPADLAVAERLGSVRHVVHLGLHRDETGTLATWHIPAAHWLESWDLVRARDGTLSPVQPLIAPLYGGLTVAELLTRMLGDAATDGHALFRAAAPDDAAREEWLRQGVVAGSAFPRVAAEPDWRVLGAVLDRLDADRAAASAGIELAFEPDPRVHDGRFANNAWLQELPEPITKLTWDNAALLAPATAARLGVRSGQWLELRQGGRALRLPALIVPGHAPDAVTLRLGGGRRAGGAVADGAGFDVSVLRTAAMPWFARGAEAVAQEGEYALAITQSHAVPEGGPLVLTATLESFRRDPDTGRDHRGRTRSLHEPYAYDTGDQWAMAIDLTLCTGCSACVVACQSENNVPVVGKEGVLDSREMHWLRIDRYYTGPPDAPRVAMQPMLCQHCEKAPCEYVCPVNATVHSPDGLNEMIYNRCVGTRFCSNNCPYKVRRFNWFDYSGRREGPERLQWNPDVTVRDRGVIEKCTFCVQRIRQGQIAARMENRALRPDGIMTACQQTCPTRAIAFGSYTNPTPELADRLESPRRYALLHELGTEPRVRYLARITNPAGPA